MPTGSSEDPSVMTRRAAASDAEQGVEKGIAMLRRKGVFADEEVSLREGVLSRTFSNLEAWSPTE